MSSARHRRAGLELDEGAGRLAPFVVGLRHDGGGLQSGAARSGITRVTTGHYQEWTFELRRVPAKYRASAGAGARRLPARSATGAPMCREPADRSDSSDRPQSCCPRHQGARQTGDEPAAKPTASDINAVREAHQRGFDLTRTRVGLAQARGVSCLRGRERGRLRYLRAKSTSPKALMRCLGDSQQPRNRVGFGRLSGLRRLASRRLNVRSGITR